MGEFKVEVVSVVEHFVSKLDDSVNGLYIIKLNGTKETIFRNCKSWGVLSHFLGEPVTKCMGKLRTDRIELVEKSINDYLGGIK